MTGILGELAKHQEKKFADTVLRYANHRLVYSSAGAAGSAVMGLGHPAVGTIGTGLVATIPITNQILKRIVSDPRAAALVRTALTTPAKAPQATLINKALMEYLPRVIQGETVGALTPEK
jgi:hypothetical protein